MPNKTLRNQDGRKYSIKNITGQKQHCSTSLREKFALTCGRLPDGAHAINGAAKPAKGTDYEVPTIIKTADTFLLATKVEIAHKPAFSFVGFDGRSLSFDDTAIDLSEQMYLRPRRGDSIDCTDC